MNILVIGSGGREHAIAWKTAQSPLCTRLYIAPGNPGTALLGTNVPLNPMDNYAITEFCLTNGVDLVLVGPETPLANGLVDELSTHGIQAFGPTQAAARMESSKQFSKAFMIEHNIPTAQYQSFTQAGAAKAYIRSINHAYVIKADGLTGGKGVFLPDTLEEADITIDGLLSGEKFGASGLEIIIEERLSGPEISLMAFADGNTAVAMLPAQDHKRLLDGQRGPNTGGMGAYAPVPFVSQSQIQEMMNQVILPVIDGMKSKGTPYNGVLYAGLMLTSDGPKVLEFNCRFGDPETQVVLPLLESDLVKIALDCINGNLRPEDVQWKDQSAVSVVMASANYPDKIKTGILISGLDTTMDNTVVFQAGTDIKNNKVITAGGRVLNVTALSSDLSGAIDLAYRRVKQISFEGMQYRTDIARGAVVETVSLYQSAGVNIDAGQEAVQRIKRHVQRTQTGNVLSDLGSFGGLFSLQDVCKLKDPVLVASTDGVGTKVKLAAQYHRLGNIGKDIVNHCIDDILVQGARPLFFLDYYATSLLQPADLEEIVAGMADACTAASCAILGGETAEMPGVYCDSEFDLAGTIVGVVEKKRILPRKDIIPGDVIIGLPSSGPHTNGYSLIRKLFANENLDQYYPEIDGNLADALLQPHENYYSWVKPVLENSETLKGMAHITGGGFYDNIPRILPDSCDALIENGSWEIPALFRFIQQKGNIAEHEMFRVFNMGIGMVLVVSAENVQKVQALLPKPCPVIGTIQSGDKQVKLHG